ncbi:MAG: aminotransferase class IV [Deltaproteobacteria bacterium]|nr:aminotransferase class IV [Deltaproteobacteria bacterium]
MVSNIVYQNGLFLEESRVKISLSDSAFLWGAGFFETLRVSQGVAVFLEDHLDRLFGSLKELQLTPPVSRIRLKFLVYETLNLNHLKEAVLRIWVSFDSGSLREMDLQKARPSLIISCKPFEAFPRELYQEGVACVVVKDFFSNAGKLASYKTNSYFNSVIAKQKAKQENAFEALLTNALGNITEGATSNIFVIHQAKLLTPSLSDGVLAGISRQKILDLAKDLDLEVQEKSLLLEDLFEAEEVFLSSSLKHVLAVSEVDGKKIGNPGVGAWTQKISEAYLEKIQWYVEQVLSDQSGLGQE